MNILYQCLCAHKVDNNEILIINLSKNSLTGASSCYIADLITCLQPHTLDLHENFISNIRIISTAMITTSTVKVINISHNDIPTQEVDAISDMMTCLQELNICKINLNDYGAGLLSKGLMHTKTLQILYMSNNNIGSPGAVTVANALKTNASLEEFYTSYNTIGKDTALATAKTITINEKLKKLCIWGYNDSIDKESVMIIIRSLHYNNSITELRLPGIPICDADQEVKVINNNRKGCCQQELVVHFTNIEKSYYR